MLIGVSCIHLPLNLPTLLLAGNRLISKHRVNTSQVVHQQIAGWSMPCSTTRLAGRKVCAPIMDPGLHEAYADGRKNTRSTCWPVRVTSRDQQVNGSAIIFGNDAQHQSQTSNPSWVFMGATFEPSADSFREGVVWSRGCWLYGPQ